MGSFYTTWENMNNSKHEHPIWQSLSTTYPLFKTVYYAHKDGKNFKEWFLSLELPFLSDLVPNIEKVDKRTMEDLLMAGSYILRIQKNDLSETANPEEEISESMQMLERLLLLNMINKKVKSFVPTSPDAFEIQYKNAWEMPHDIKKSEKIKFSTK